MVDKLAARCETLKAIMQRWAWLCSGMMRKSFRPDIVMKSIMKDVEDHSGSSDLQAIERTLARAAEAEVKNEKVDKLAARCETLKPIMKDVEDHIGSSDLQAVERTLARAAEAEVKNEMVDKLAARCETLKAIMKDVEDHIG